MAAIYEIVSGHSEDLTEIKTTLPEHGTALAQHGTALAEVRSTAQRASHFGLGGWAAS